MPSTTLQRPDNDGPHPHLVIQKITNGYRIRTLAYLPDGRVVIGAWDRTVRVLNIEDGTQDGISMEHDAELYSLAVTQDGSKIISSDMRGTIKVWDVQSHAPAKAWVERPPNGCPMIAISSNDQLLAVGDWTVLIYTMDGEWLLDQTIEVGKKVCCMSFSPGGDKFACGTTDGIRVYNLSNGSLVFDPTSYQELTWSLLWSHDGSRLFSGSHDAAIRCWNYETGVQIGHPWTGHTDTIDSLCLSPDGSILASASSDRTVRFWDTSTVTPIGQPLRHDRRVDEIRFSPSGEFLASVGPDGTLYLWRVPTMNRPLGRSARPNFNTTLSDLMDQIEFEYVFSVGLCHGHLI